MPERVYYHPKLRDPLPAERVRSDVFAWRQSQRYLRNSIARLLRSASWLVIALICSASIYVLSKNAKNVELYSKLNKLHLPLLLCILRYVKNLFQRLVSKKVYFFVTIAKCQNFLH